jgi:hypothetical protein
MSIVGVEKRLVLDIVRFLFGETAEKIASAIIDYSSYPLGLMVDVTSIPLTDTRTVTPSCVSTAWSA